MGPYVVELWVPILQSEIKRIERDSVKGGRDWWEVNGYGDDIKGFLLERREGKGC